MTGETDWIEWKGGKCPVPLTAFVTVRYRDGEEDLIRARDAIFKQGDWWKHDGEPTYDLTTDEEGVCHSCDIIAYRIVDPSNAN